MLKKGPRLLSANYQDSSVYMVGVKVTLVITWCYFGCFGDHMDISEEDGLLVAIKVFSNSTEQWRPMTLQGCLAQLTINHQKNIVLY